MEARSVAPPSRVAVPCSIADPKEEPSPATRARQKPQPLLWTLPRWFSKIELSFVTPTASLLPTRVPGRCVKGGFWKHRDCQNSWMTEITTGLALDIASQSVSQSATHCQKNSNLRIINPPTHPTHQQQSRFCAYQYSTLPNSIHGY